MELRYVTEDDLPRVGTLERECFSLPWSEASLAYAMREPHTRMLAATEDGTVIGYAVGCILFEEMEIMNLAVDAGFRRRGVGAALLSALLAEGERAGCTRALLEVRESNTAARTLYSRFGFTAYGRRAGYYRLPMEDAILMERRKDTRNS